MAEDLLLRLDTSYEELMSYKLENTDNDLDKREVTSMLYNAFAGNSLETVKILFTMRNFSDQVFADTAPREYLIRRAAERGITPLQATFAMRKGVFNIEVPIGSRFSIEDVNYTVVEKPLGAPLGVFTLRAETAGTIGNAYSGTLFPITYINGLQSAQLTDILIPGEDEEDTETLRSRYFNSFKNIAFAGNRADYKQKVNAIPGVGGVKVFRAWQGGGTVKLTIIDSTFKVPTQTLIDTVQEIIDPLNMQGEGVGLAPIDHIVTVVGATQQTVNITFNITFENGFEFADIEQQLNDSIDEYFTELGRSFGQGTTPQQDAIGLIVRISQLENRVLNLPGVIDVQDTLINGNPTNLEIGIEMLPVRGTVSG